MGLNVTVGDLGDLRVNDEEGYRRELQELEVANGLLESRGLPAHIEPENLDFAQVVSFDMYGYAGLHYLRRIAAHVWFGGALPEPGDEKAPEDPVLQQYYNSLGESKVGLFSKLVGKKPPEAKERFDHLVLHSDSEGYYVPVDFEHVISDDAGAGLRGGVLGSSPRLHAECRRIAELLELPPDLDPEAEEVWQATETQGEGEEKWQRYGIESFTCLRLRAAAAASVELGAAIVFR